MRILITPDKMMFIVIPRRHDEESKAYAIRNKASVRFFTPPCFVQNDILLEALRFQIMRLACLEDAAGLVHVFRHLL